MQGKAKELFERQMPRWWVPAMNRHGKPTGIAHVVHGGRPLCGSMPSTCGQSYASPAQANCRACKRCQAIIERMRQQCVTSSTPAAG